MEHEATVPSPEIQRAVSTEIAWRYRVIPRALENGTLLLQTDATANSDDLLDELELLLGHHVKLEPAPTDVIQRALSSYYKRTSRGEKTIDLSSKDAEGLISDLLQEARELGSSDIHIEAQEETSRIRLRVDGVLVERYRFAKSDHQALVNKLKVRAQLDIAEKRLPQDGRLLLRAGGHRIDVRISVLPTLHGEKMVMRILGSDASEIKLEALGMKAHELDEYRMGFQRPNGLVLISGPTGSGKTTTLYATIRELNEIRRNILTIEDPIEYTLDGINQVQLREDIGLGFPQALRTFLRQDPDVIMVGEIRDSETAQMAIRAALTGHLVLSTIHTNSAWGTVSRLLDMGIPAFLLSSALSTSVAQRLVRKLCAHCKLETRTRPELLPKGLDIHTFPKTYFEPGGCESCGFTGYKGRFALYEVIRLDAELSRLVREGVHDATDALQNRQIRPLRSGAIEAVRSGNTSLEEAWPLLID